MANKKIGLGGLGESLMTENAEGINALLDVNIRAEGSDDDAQSNGTALAGFVEMNIGDIITNPNQPRKEFDEESLNELAQSIKAIGIIQPIAVTKNGDKYEIVAGERRFRAAQIAGLEKVPVLIKDLSLREKLEIALIENIQRENLNAVEEALAYSNLIQQYNLTQEELSERVGKSRSAIANAMRLLGLDPIIQKMLIDRQITAGHAKAILSVEDEADRLGFAVYLRDNQVSVREAEALSKKWPIPISCGKSSSGNGTGIREVEIVNAERELAETLQTKVTINGTSFKGKIQIEYFSLDELERLIELIKK